MNKSKKNTRKHKKTTKNTRKHKKPNKNTRKHKKTNKNTIGGVKVLTIDGEFTTDAEILHEGKDFFRKMTNIIAEKKICELLMKNPHKNIVKIYDVGKDYVDMELLDDDISIEDMSKIKNIMMEVKTYLQSLGIIYIDWKLDNIGISEDGQFKLFDFNASGLIDIETKKWTIKPIEWWSYNKAIEDGMVTPSDIDNYSFDIEFKRKKYN
jgi:serine/threonine protein kinase